MNFIFLRVMEEWTQWVPCKDNVCHLLCTCPIAFILPWLSEKWNLFLKCFVKYVILFARVFVLQKPYWTSDSESSTVSAERRRVQIKSSILPNTVEWHFYYISVFPIYKAILDRRTTKTMRWPMRTAKTRISLGIFAQFDPSSLSA